VIWRRNAAIPLQGRLAAVWLQVIIIVTTRGLGLQLQFSGAVHMLR